jgi:hypothetical protein
MAHFLLCGDTGMGKSVLIHNWLSQIRERKPPERALIYDPALEFWECHGRPGDILLHPLSGACPFWDLADELRTSLDARAMTKSFLPDRKHGQPDFWDLAPQRLLGFLLMRLSEERKTIQELLGWLSDPGIIDTMVSGTTLAPLIAPEAPAQRAGVLASLNLVAEALELLPSARGRERFSFRSWAESPDEDRWVFIASPPRERTALRPLVSAWLDTALGHLLYDRRSVPTWLFVDELPTLQKLPKLKDALQEARKYNLRCVLGFQGRAQLEQCYGREAETLLSAPTTRILLKTKEPAAAEWCAKNIGQPEQERGTESVTTAVGEGRDSVNLGTECRADYLVLPNEIQNLPERTGYLRYDEYAVRIHFDYLTFPVRNPFPVELPAPRPLLLPAPRAKLSLPRTGLMLEV